MISCLDSNQPLMKLNAVCQGGYKACWVGGLDAAVCNKRCVV